MRQGVGFERGVGKSAGTTVRLGGGKAWLYMKKKEGSRWFSKEVIPSLVAHHVHRS